MNSEKLMASGTRLYYLDWLRVIAFGLLVFYHSGLIFVDWGYHIQNDKLSENFKLPLLFMNQWRIPLLFFVSGAGVKFALGNKMIGSFMKERFTRLFIPLVFGILVVIPPQVYFERLSQYRFSGSYLNFYPEFFKGVYPEGNFTWNHLWFLAYLFVFVIISLPLLFYFNSTIGKKVFKKLTQTINGKTGFLILLLMLLLTEYFLRDTWPDTRNLISDWYNFIFYFITFLSGYIIASTEKIWDTIEKNRKILFLSGIVSFCIIYLGWHRNGVNFLETMPYGDLILKFFKCLNILSWIFCGIGFCKKTFKLHKPVSPVCK